MLAQALTLEFKKSVPRPILTVRRADGTATWMKLYPGMAMHDLTHYVIESVLALDNAFYGILARGYDIEAFELPPEKRPYALQPKNLPPEALQVEHLVNLLLTELQSGERITDFQDLFQSILTEADLPVMGDLTDVVLSDIREQVRELQASWRLLPVGGQLVFTLE